MIRDWQWRSRTFTRGRPGSVDNVRFSVRARRRLWAVPISRPGRIRVRLPCPSRTLPPSARRRGGSACPLARGGNHFGRPTERRRSCEMFEFLMFFCSPEGQCTLVFRMSGDLGVIAGRKASVAPLPHHAGLGSAPTGAHVCRFGGGLGLGLPLQFFFGPTQALHPLPCLAASGAQRKRIPQWVV